MECIHHSAYEILQEEYNKLYLGTKVGYVGNHINLHLLGRGIFLIKLFNLPLGGFITLHSPAFDEVAGILHGFSSTQEDCLHIN